DIMPQINNSFQIGQTFFKKYNLILGYDNADRYLAEIPFTDAETGITYLTTGNLNYFKSYNATIVAPVEIASFWQANNNLVLSQQDYNLEIGGEKIENNNFFYMAQSNHQVNLPGDIQLEMNASLRGPTAYGVYNIDSQWWVDAGLKKSFMDDKLNVSLRATDIFKTMDMGIIAQYNGNTFNLDQYFWNQAVSLNLRYNFSKGAKAERKTKANKLEELDRAGN
ncbi:MAG: outer membrane beta-barrel protein, partial [Flavobacteriaceae bacterium]|nr:outer membrane beta-barrel protein [Flavobacteriaceae bacterium]